MNEKWMRPVELMEILMNFLTVFCVETALFSALVPLSGALEGEALGEGSGVLAPPALPAQVLLIAVPDQQQNQQGRNQADGGKQRIYLKHHYKNGRA